MTLSKPIPKALLPHTAQLLTPKTTGIFTDGDFDEVTLHNIRFEKDEKTRQIKSGEARVKAAKIYFDCVNSTPKNMQFGTTQLIEFCGKKYKIESVKTIMAGNKIHHYKIEAI